MQVKSIADRMLKREHSATLSTCIKLPHGFKTFVLSFFEWPLKTGFTVYTPIRLLSLLLSYYIQVNDFSVMSGLLILSKQTVQTMMKYFILQKFLIGVFPSTQHSCLPVDSSDYFCLVNCLSCDLCHVPFFVM